MLAFRSALIDVTSAQSRTNVPRLPNAIDLFIFLSLCRIVLGFLYVFAGAIAFAVVPNAAKFIVIGSVESHTPSHRNSRKVSLADIFARGPFFQAEVGIDLH